MGKTFNISSLFIASVLLGYIQTASASTLECGEYTGCQRKFCEIEKQITIAESKGNSDKVDGLKIALRESKSHCDVGMLKDELASDISDVNEEILEYENDLKEAKLENKPDKIIKYNNKIAEENIKLDKLQAELKRLN
ncbi:DUF1090 domain-containing protein [Photobacterium sp. S4TG1]|uniref:DUF1090 domain-containing protein n=1 Tax=Photobacterium sp. S4TG1 TaxID=3114587 RepID=UPI002E16CFA6|nr:DUF1090 domain-containing protein [Photobacterium sp. S4TG1]